MFKYCLDRSFDELCSSIEACGNDLNNPELKIEVSYRLGTCLHWLINSLERIVKNKICETHKPYISALRYANNKLKHDVMLIELYQRSGGFTFPIRLTFIIPAITFRWLTLENSNSKYQEQFNNYKTFLQGKDLIETITEAKDIITKYIE